MNFVGIPTYFLCLGGYNENQEKGMPWPMHPDPELEVL